MVTALRKKKVEKRGEMGILRVYRKRLSDQVIFKLRFKAVRHMLM